MADSGWGCKSNGANPRWGCKSNFDGAVSPMGRCVHTNWGAQYRGAVSPASTKTPPITRRQMASDPVDHRESVLIHLALPSHFCAGVYETRLWAVVE